MKGDSSVCLCGGTGSVWEHQVGQFREGSEGKNVGDVIISVTSQL
jgi:hypothetical protein